MGAETAQEEPGDYVLLSFCLSFSLSLSLSRARALSLSLARALALAPRLIHNCVIEDTINNPTCSNGVLPSRTPLTSQPAAMVSCPHYSSLCLSVVFSFCLGLSLTRRSSLALSLSLSRARSLLLEGSSTFVPSRTPLTSQPAGMVSCSHPLSSSLPISGSLSLSLAHSLTHSLTRSLTHSLTHSFAHSLTLIS